MKYNISFEKFRNFSKLSRISTNSRTSKISKTLAMVATAIVLLASCSDDFLAEKRPFGGSAPLDDVYSNTTGVNMRLNYLYTYCMPPSNAEQNNKQRCGALWPIGTCDFLSSNTDEFAVAFKTDKEGSASWINPNVQRLNTDIEKFFWYGINESQWKKIRECNDIITNTNASPTLSDEFKKTTEAQARFLRAMVYYRLFKRYGGLPLVDHLQSTIIQGDEQSLHLPRTSTEQTANFIIDDLKWAAENLPAKWEDPTLNWGRITSGAALALAGMTANYYASPVFNRQDEQDRWQNAYELNKKAIETLNAGNYGLAFATNPGDNASSWAKIWCNSQCSDGSISEAVLVTNHNNTAPSTDGSYNNKWEQYIRPKAALGDASVTPSAEMVDEFPMADGRRPTETGEYIYDKKLFWLNRDPRFYRTFAFPGVEWKFDGMMNTFYSKETHPYQTGGKYEVWDFAWYENLDKATDAVQKGYYANLNGNNGHSVYVRKKSQDSGLGITPMYNWENGDSTFNANGQPEMFIRYTEVLLNFAEAACGANHLDEAYDALLKIRQRVGYTEDCGLNQEIRSNRAKMFEAILYERKIELAYEGKRFDDCVRWMLFDGGAFFDELPGGCPDGWKPTGWGGNTCEYLGVTPLDGFRRHQLEMYIEPAYLQGSKDAKNDPFNPHIDNAAIRKTIGEKAMLEGPMPWPKALTLSEDITSTGTDDGVIYANANVQALADFYNIFLQRKDIEVMSTDDLELMPKWRPEYYILGLGEGDQTNNPGVVQTIGWNSVWGGMGIYDPLSKNPRTDISEEKGK